MLHTSDVIHNIWNHKAHSVWDLESQCGQSGWEAENPTLLTHTHTHTHKGQFKAYISEEVVAAYKYFVESWLTYSVLAFHGSLS